MQVLEHRPLWVLDNETTETKAPLRVLVKLVHVAQLVEDGAERDRTREHAGHSVPARTHWADEGLALELSLLGQLRELGARVRAAKNLACEPEDLNAR